MMDLLTKKNATSTAWAAPTTQKKAPRAPRLQERQEKKRENFLLLFLAMLTIRFQSRREDFVERAFPPANAKICEPQRRKGRKERKEREERRVQETLDSSCLFFAFFATFAPLRFASFILWKDRPLSRASARQCPTNIGLRAQPRDAHSESWRSRRFLGGLRALCPLSVAASSIWALLLIPAACLQPRAEAQVCPSSAATTTSPASQPAGELNLLAMGDWGEGRPAQKKVADAMADYVARQHEPFAALLSAGDNFYVPIHGIDDPTWQTLFEKMYDPARLNFPFYIALGNHDYEQEKYRIELAYARAHPESRWKQPGRWFRVDLPEKQPLVTIIMLDSDHDDLTAAEWNEEKEFLERELARPRAAWTICCAHHPLFSNGVSADNGVLQNDWGKLFKKHNVDIYLCGHEHNLEHLEIPGWNCSFVIAGGGGAHSHPLIRDNRGPFSRSVYGFVHFDLTPDRVTVRFIGASGQPLHVFERSKAGEVKVLMTTPSDSAIARPLEAIQGLFDKLHPAKTQPSTEPAR